MTDTSKERCEAVAAALTNEDWPTVPDKDVADLITALCERVTKLEGERDDLQRLVNDDMALTEVQAWLKTATARAVEAEDALAEALRETDAIIEPFARFVNPSPQGAWDGPNIAMGDFQRADKYRRKRFEQTKYKGAPND